MPGLAFALARILVIAPFPLIFKWILDRYKAAKNIGGIVALSLWTLALLGAHHFPVAATLANCY